MSVVVMTTVVIAGGAAASFDFFAFPNFPLPEEALQLVAAGPAVQLEPGEVLIEGYVLDSRKGRPVESAAVFPGVFNQPAPEIPDSLAVTDQNGFYSIVVDRDRYTHLAVVCRAPAGQVASPARFGRVELPRAEVGQAERTFRLHLSRRDRRCEYPIDRPRGPVFTTQ